MFSTKKKKQFQQNVLKINCTSCRDELKDLMNMLIESMRREMNVDYLVLSLIAENLKNINMSSSRGIKLGNENKTSLAFNTSSR